MNFKAIFFITTLAVISVASTEIKKKRQSTDQSLGSLAFDTILAVIAPLAVGSIQSLWSSVFKPNKEQKQTILGRPMLVKTCEDGPNCISITDLESGIITFGTGSTYQEAVGEVTKSIYEELLSDGRLSLHDLCDLHISFPHPNTDKCSGITIDPCKLIYPVDTTPKPCVDLHGKYCATNSKRCNEPMFHDHMMENCFKTCTNGLCTTSSSDPCA